MCRDPHLAGESADVAAGASPGRRQPAGRGLVRPAGRGRRGRRGAKPGSGGIGAMDEASIGLGPVIVLRGTGAAGGKFAWRSCDLRGRHPDARTRRATPRPMLPSCTDRPPPLGRARPSRTPRRGRQGRDRIALAIASGRVVSTTMPATGSLDDLAHLAEVAGDDRDPGGHVLEQLVRQRVAVVQARRHDRADADVGRRRVCLDQLRSHRRRAREPMRRWPRRARAAVPSRRRRRGARAARPARGRSHRPAAQGPDRPSVRRGRARPALSGSIASPPGRSRSSRRSGGVTGLGIVRDEVDDAEADTGAAGARRSAG